MGLGLIFPGQGSQQVGMGAEFSANHGLAAQLFDEANDALGFDLKRICLAGPEDELTLTYHAQPAILTVSLIAFRLMAERAEISPLNVAGHSMGEYTALVAVGAMDFADAVRTVHQRGKFMQEATPVGVGAMAAILGMEAEELQRLCEEEAHGQVVAPANFNAPGQIVISGDAGAVKRVLARGKGKLLPVSAPFHSALMVPAAERMAEVLEAVNFSDASAPLMANASNEFLTQAGDFPASLVAQITAPVRWDTGIQAMIKAGAKRFIEAGHGKILAGMNRRIDKSVETLGVQDEASLKATLETISR
ncbi:MAG: ACP S-malonyltransferase [SAR324 cluster bacterium]|nr:ACP S-malonyltransferase [SAR324 cluster bacterium]